MKKISSLLILAAIPLFFLPSCDKHSIVELPEEATTTVIDPWLANPVTNIKTIPGPSVSITATGSVETKSHLEMNGTGNFAKVIWDAGDEFEMYAGSNSAVFTTVNGGEKAAFETVHTLPQGTKAYAFYAPLSDKVVEIENVLTHFNVLTANPLEWGFGIKVPAEQTAKANDVTKGLNFAYAESNDYEENLTFKNMLALVRIKMTGSIASTVTSVTLRSASSLAGDCVLVPTANGTPVLTFSKKFKGDVASQTVTLTGTFAADTYYYFAVVPGTQSGFSLTFSGGNGHSITKIASKAVTFARGEINDIPTIALGSSWPSAGPGMSTIKWNTASAGAAKPVTFAVVPDGFTAAEMPLYEMLAKSAMNTMFNVEPFKSYKEYFNVYIMKVASNESGARITDGTDAEKTRECYFESEWGKDDYDHMKANDNKVFAYVANNCPDIGEGEGKHTIEEVPVLIIINDTRYGGKNITYNTGRAYCMAPYTYSGGGLSWSYPALEAISDSDPSQGAQNTPTERLAEVGTNTGNWLNTMVHEFAGHCFGRLADEYWYDKASPSVDHISTYDWTVPFGHNVSATYNNPGKDDTYGTDGWNFLLNEDKTAKTSLVATNPLYNRIGVYQGAKVSILNRWRSERVSCMIDNRFYFSTFQRYLIVKRIMTLAGATFDEDSFWAKDVPIDPVRDIVSSSVMGESNSIPPRPVPLLPPPTFVVVD